MKNNLNVILKAVGCESNFKMSVGEISYSSTSKRFGENGKFNKSHFSTKDASFEISSKEDSCEIDLVLAFEKVRKVVEEVAEPEVKEAKAVTPEVAPEKDFPDLYFPIEIENYTDEYLKEKISKMSLDEFIEWEDKLYKATYDESMELANSNAHKKILSKHGVDYKLNRLRDIRNGIGYCSK